MGEITKESKISSVASVGDWAIEEKTVTEIFEDGVLISTSNSRKCYHPLSKELTSEDIDPRVISLARTQNWQTDDVKKAFIEKQNVHNAGWDKNHEDAYEGLENGLTS